MRPRVVVIEYNAKFPPDVEWKQAYDSKHIWDGSDWQGASLKSYELLGHELGYQLVGTNFNGVNAFFVRKDLAGDKFIMPATAENLYNPYRHNFIRFKSGIVSRYCLVGQQDELGIRNYYEEAKIRWKRRGFKAWLRHMIFRVGYAWRNG
ncbi:MAG: hypothetical protein IJR27_00510 [Synergistaceae bacterium]|nr:hypothetical protein [Synergistaceae bacterium]